MINGAATRSSTELGTTSLAQIRFSRCSAGRL